MISFQFNTVSNFKPSPLNVASAFERDSYSTHSCMRKGEIASRAILTYAAMNRVDDCFRQTQSTVSMRTVTVNKFLLIHSTRYSHQSSCPLSTQRCIRFLNRTAGRPATVREELKSASLEILACSISVRVSRHYSDARYNTKYNIAEAELYDEAAQTSSRVEATYYVLVSFIHHSINGIELKSARSEPC